MAVKSRNYKKPDGRQINIPVGHKGISYRQPLNNNADINDEKQHPKYGDLTIPEIPPNDKPQGKKQKNTDIKFKW